MLQKRNAGAQELLPLRYQRATQVAYYNVVYLIAFMFGFQVLGLHDQREALKDVGENIYKEGSTSGNISRLRYL
ncbi:hypothetical protein ES703_119330 [subsurface metagenome]